MRILHLPPVLLALPLLLLACLDSDADPVSAGEEEELTLGALRGSGEASADPASSSDDYEVVIKDDVNWHVMLNRVETVNAATRYAGVLYFRSGGRDIEGPAKAIWNSDADVITIQTTDNHDEQKPHMLAYGMVLEGLSGNGQQMLRGGWAYVEGRWQGRVTATVTKGTFPN